MRKLARAPSSQSSVSHVVSCTSNSVSCPVVSPPSCSVDHVEVDGKPERQTLMPTSLQISRLTNSVTNKTLVTSTMKRDSSGPACSGPVVVVPRKRIRVAPSTARVSLESPSVTQDRTRLSCIGGAAKPQIQHSIAPSSTRGQSENLVGKNLKIWTVQPVGPSMPNTDDPTAQQDSSIASVLAPTMPAARVELKRSRSATDTKSQHKRAHGERALLLADGSSPRLPFNGCDSAQPESARDRYTPMHSD